VSAMPSLSPVNKLDGNGKRYTYISRGAILLLQHMNPAAEISCRISKNKTQTAKDQ